MASDDKTPGDQQSLPEAPRHSPFDPHIWMWLAVMFLGYYFYTDQASVKPEKIAYSEFKQAVVRGTVDSVSFKLDQIRGRYKETTNERNVFITTLPGVADNALMPLLEEHNVRIEAETIADPGWLQLLIGILPWLFIAAFFVYSSRMLQQRIGGAGGGLFDFQRSRARRFESRDNETTFADVAGLESAKQDLQEVIDFLKHPEKFQRIGANLPRGILLMGSPGTGKTLLAKACAHEAGVPFFSVSASEFIEMYVGVGASRVRDMFKNARDNAPSLIFIDEIDSIGRVRGAGLGGGHDEREQTLNQILAEMDGFSKNEVVIVLAATNRPDVLDPALLRPGRFDRKVTLELPQRNARSEILRVHLRSVPTDDDVDIDEIATRTAGFSGADLANLVNEGALLAARNNRQSVTREDFARAHDKVVMGSERPDLLNPSERQRTAIHESGHALTAILLPSSDPLHQVSIIPRGRALGATEQLPSEDRHNFSQPYIEARLAVMLGGRAAEKLMLASVSSGAADDLEQASRLARMMITQWGMSEVIGPVHFRAGSEHPFLGYELTQDKDYSEDTAAKIDSEVKNIIEAAEQTSLGLLTENRSRLERLVAELIQKETLDKAAIDALFSTPVSIEKSNQVPAVEAPAANH